MFGVKNTITVSLFILLSFAAVVAQQPPPAPVAHAEAGTWVNVAPANMGFTVQMPAKPAEKSEPVQGREGVQNRLLTLETKLAGYVFSLVEFPDEISDPAVIKDMLDRGREGGLSASGGQLKSEKEIKLDGYFGREWSIALPQGLSATARAYWVKRRLYQTVFIMNPNAGGAMEAKLRGEAVKKFLDSFALTGK
jgi:hypothetical protein